MPALPNITSRSNAQSTVCSSRHMIIRKGSWSQPSTGGKAVGRLAEQVGKVGVRSSGARQVDEGRRGGGMCQCEREYSCVRRCGICVNLARIVCYTSHECLEYFPPAVLGPVATLTSSLLGLGQDLLLLQLVKHPLQTLPRIHVPAEARFPRLAHAEH